MNRQDAGGTYIMDYTLGNIQRISYLKSYIITCNSIFHAYNIIRKHPMFFALKLNCKNIVLIIMRPKPSRIPDCTIKVCATFNWQKSLHPITQKIHAGE